MFQVLGVLLLVGFIFVQSEVTREIKSNCHVLARLEVVVVFESGLRDFVKLVSVNYDNSFLELPQDLQRVLILQDTVVDLRLVVTSLGESDSGLLFQLS
jgi:hypothetical protein